MIPIPIKKGEIEMWLKKYCEYIYIDRNVLKIKTNKKLVRYLGNDFVGWMVEKEGKWFLYNLKLNHIKNTRRLITFLLVLTNNIRR